MINSKKKIMRFFLCIMIAFFMLSSIFKYKVYARERTEDISNLTNYPEIYTAIQELKTAHPNWTFTILYTGLDWNNVLYNETTALHTRSLVHNSIVTDNIQDWVCPDCGTAPKDNGSWYCASQKTAAYYIDPRNWLNETYIFAFETLSFNSNVHTVEGVQAILSGTFMDAQSIPYIDVNGVTQTINKSYAQIIFEAGQANNVSPYHLAARIRQEQGGGGSSLISGTYTAGDGTIYTGYYNYFNVAASGNTEAEIIQNGLEKAKEKNWTTPELAIIGGAEVLKGGYIGSYQDTLYLQKYHVDSASKYYIYGHQYQQNVSAPYTESLDVYDAYEELGILDSNFNFVIPVYENMPNIASAKPGRNLTLTTENVIVTTTVTPLSIRSGPSTDYGIRAKAPKDTILVRIEKAETVSSDGRYWDRVAYNTGAEIIIGYASREYMADVETAEVVQEAATIGIMCNLRNGPGTTKAKVKQILNPGTNITIIDKLTYKIDGHIWYRVKLEDGTQGYISSAYIQTEPVVVELYKIEGEHIKIAPGTNLADISGCILNAEVAGTGASVTLSEVPYTLVVLGDVNGDGNITPLDYVFVKNHIMQINILDGAKKLSADAKSDGNITPLDYVIIKNHIMNMGKITL